MKHFHHIDHDVIRQNLQKVLDSKTFGRSGRLRTFLEYVVNKEQAGLSHQLKGYAIGIDVFSRSETFDPGGDPLVRVQAGKLRKLLDQYYASEGKNAPMRILIPRGTYVPTYEWKAPIEPTLPTALATSEEAPPQPAAPPASRPRKRYRLRSCAIALTVANFAAFGIHAATLLASPNPPQMVEAAPPVPAHPRELSALPQLFIHANLPEASRLHPLADAVKAAIEQMNSVELTSSHEAKRDAPQQDPRLDFIVSVAGTGTPERVAMLLHHKLTGKFVFARTYASPMTPTDFLYQANSFVEEALAFNGKLYQFAKAGEFSSPLMDCLTITTQYTREGTRASFLRAVDCQKGLTTDDNRFVFISNPRNLRELARRSDLERMMSAPAS